MKAIVSARLNLALRAAAAVLAPVSVAVIVTPAHAAGAKLPKPYVSRGLDAVLMPIDASVRRQFKLSPKSEGVLVISAKPGGVAAKSGIKPGDVISRVKGHKIAKPIDLDTAVYYWIKKGISDFLFDGWRGPAIYHPRSTITLVLYEEPIDIRTVDDWVAVPASDGFSYTEYYEEYSTEITETYETSESYIEETATSSEYSTEVTEESTHETSFETEEATASDHDATDDRDDDHDNAMAPDDDDHHDASTPDDNDSTPDDSGDSPSSDEDGPDAG